MQKMITVSNVIENEILDGMRLRPKQLPSKYFYDERGSHLFDEITRLEEYYLSRTERWILETYMEEIADILGPDIELIEPGSGSSEKTRLLLDRLSELRCYVPIDISASYLEKIAEGLRNEYPKLYVEPLSADYTRPFKLPDTHPSLRRIVFFPGSTIGNFEQETVRSFLQVIANIVGTKGGVLIGVDLKKDVETLEAAYNDSKGVTNNFNKNLLMHLNHKIGSNFDPDKFVHHSVWVEDKGRIEMRLVALQTHTVEVAGQSFLVEEGEYLHTENSHKFTLDEFSDLVSPWFEVAQSWTDPASLFSLQFLIPHS
jgi:dimethylhistidine N-methyltransferase